MWRPTGTDGAGFAGARSPVPNSNSASRARDVDKPEQVSQVSRRTYLRPAPISIVGPRRLAALRMFRFDRSTAICILINVRPAETDVVNFLRAALGGRARPVAKLEVKARAAGLLGDGQQITRAKHFFAIVL